MSKLTAATTIMKVLNSRKSATAKEIESKTGLNAKTIRNKLGNLVSEGVVDYSEYLRSCKVSGKEVTAYTAV